MRCAAPFTEWMLAGKRFDCAYSLRVRARCPVVGGRLAAQRAVSDPLCGHLLQGVSCFIAGLFGTANGTTAYNENTGAMQITGVGSRIVVQTGACIIIVVAIIGAPSVPLACGNCVTADVLHEHL